MDTARAFTLKVMINKGKTKVLFAEANSGFVDVFLSFLTMPLGKVMKVLEKHYGDKAPVIGSLNTLYKGLGNLDSVHFWTEAGKQLLLNPRSTFEAECRSLQLDLTDTHPPEHFTCGNCSCRVSVISIYYDAASCKCCGCPMKREISQKEPQVVPGGGGGGVFTTNSGSFFISDDLQILPDVTELTQIIRIFGIKDIDGAEVMHATFRFTEIMDLFKTALFSPTPLSDVILHQNRQMNSASVKFALWSSSLFAQIEKDATWSSNFNKMNLKVFIQKSTNKLLYAHAGEDFIDFLYSFLAIPLGRILSVLGEGSYFKSVENLYRSIADDLLLGKFLKTPEMKNRLTKMKLPHGTISGNQILPLTAEESLDALQQSVALYSAVKFPRGQGTFVKGPRRYQVADDLTVTPFCLITSLLAALKGLKIPTSDIKEVELQVGPHEALRIMKVSLTSPRVLTDALMKKEPKRIRRLICNKASIILMIILVFILLDTANQERRNVGARESTGRLWNFPKN